MQPQQMKELQKRQLGYVISNTVATEIGPVEVKRPVITDWQGNLVTHFPVETSDHEVQTVARILQGTVNNETVEAIYCLHNGVLSGSKEWVIGELICIPGVVKDGVILATYPELKGNYDAAQYDVVKQMAALLNGAMENIVYQTYYRK